MTEDGNRRAVRTDKAPAPAFSYSQGIVSGGLLFVSGQVPIDPVTKAVPEGFGDQVRQTLDNVAAIAEAAGGRLADAVRVGVYLANLDDFDEMDAAYREYFEAHCRRAPPWVLRSAVLPSRSTLSSRSGVTGECPCHRDFAGGECGPGKCCAQRPLPPRDGAEGNRS